MSYFCADIGECFQTLFRHVVMKFHRWAQWVRKNNKNFLLYTTENMLPNDNVSMSVGHLDQVLIVYSSMEHVTWKSLGPTCG